MENPLNPWGGRYPWGSWGDSTGDFTGNLEKFKEREGLRKAEKILFKKEVKVKDDDCLGDVVTAREFDIIAKHVSSVINYDVSFNDTFKSLKTAIKDIEKEKLEVEHIYDKYKHHLLKEAK